MHTNVTGMTVKANCVNPVHVKISSPAALFCSKFEMQCSHIKERQCISSGTYVMSDLLFPFCVEPKQMLNTHINLVFSMFFIPL